MTMSRSVMVVGVATVVVLVGSSRWSIQAQVGRAFAPQPVVPVRPAPPPLTKPATAVSAYREPLPTAQDALLRPFSWNLREETKLSNVVALLKAHLSGPVVLDLAALNRHKLTPEAMVRLELEGARLKTGLKLLLDQVGLTYRVVPEDNLLILTDAEGAEDPLDRILAEIRSLHNDIHTLQDTVDDLREDLGGKSESGPVLRKPTIIEEMPPGDDHKAMPEEAPAHSRPGM